MILVDVVEDCIENQTQYRWIVFQSEWPYHNTYMGRPGPSIGYITLPCNYICSPTHRQSSLVFANNYKVTPSLANSVGSLFIYCHETRSKKNASFFLLFA